MRDRDGYVLERLTDEFWPVFECGCQAAAVDVIELFAVRPIRFNIINFETNVWRDPA